MPLIKEWNLGKKMPIGFLDLLKKIGIMQRIRPFIGLPLIFWLLAFALQAQRSVGQMDPDVLYKEGYTLFQKRQFQASKVKMLEYLSQANGLYLQDAEYYAAAASTELFQQEAMHRLSSFIYHSPENPKISMAWFQRGNVMFRDRKYQEAESNFAKADPFVLTKLQWSEFYFKLGYAQFMNNKLEDALVSFSKTKDIESPYRGPAVYYAGHIHYAAEQWESSLGMFQRIQEEKAFSKVVPLYIAQIYYRQKRYRDLIQYAAPLADTLRGPTGIAVLRMMAESEFKLGQYVSAIGHYNSLIKKGGVLDREGNYNLGIAHYEEKDFKSASGYFSKSADKEDSLAQTAFYYMSDCYLKLGQKKLALDALRLAYALKKHPKITREALFQFAKLSYELGYNPYNEAVEALEEYLEAYDKSEFAEEARQLMVEIYLSSKNYRQAIVALDKMPRKSPTLQQALQRVLYFRAVELFNNLEFQEAEAHFERAVGLNFDPTITAEAFYWWGEANFKQGKYIEAIQQWEKFTKTPTGPSSAALLNVYYNLGYAHLKQKKYVQALAEFRTYLDSEKGKAEPQNRTDALLRTADCYFALKKFEFALEYYAKAESTAKYRSDYGHFQWAMLQGIAGNQKEKSRILAELLELFPKSPLAEEALFEQGIAQMRVQELKAAQIVFQRVLSEYPAGTLQGKASLQIGIIYRNLGEDQSALDWLKKVSANYPGSPEAALAVGYIKSIYTEAGQVEEWLAFAQNSGQVNASRAELDSSAYFAVQNAVQSGACDKIIKASDSYLAAFPSGFFVQEVAHQLGECHFSQEKDALALQAFTFILNGPKGAYTENALVKVGYVFRSQPDTAQAIRIYLELESVAGTAEVLKEARGHLMDLYFGQSDWRNAIFYADKLLTLEKVSGADRDRYYFIKTRSHYSIEEYELGLASGRKMSANANTEQFAEVAFIMADVLRIKKEFTQAERELRQNVKKMSNHPHWVAKSLILLSDIYLELGNLSQAKATLKSVIDHHDGPELVALAQERYQHILNLEQEKNRVQDVQSEELNLEPNGQ
jgi:tetratricopeptide (TPR) repeat protein